MQTSRVFLRSAPGHLGQGPEAAFVSRGLGVSLIPKLRGPALSRLPFGIPTGQIL